MASLRTAVLALTVAAAGCAADSGDNALLILANRAPDDGCTFSAEASGAAFASGRYDVQYLDATNPGAYLAAPLVQNLTLVDDSAHPELVARRTALMKGVHVSISFTDETLVDKAALDAAGLLKFDARFAGSIEPNLGLGVFPVEVVPYELLLAVKDALAAHPDVTHVGLIVSLSAYGEIGGGTVESAAFELPVDVCSGCLTQDHGACSSLPTTFTPRTGGFCDVRQDGVVDCCTTDAGAVCPAVGTGST